MHTCEYGSSPAREHRDQKNTARKPVEKRQHWQQNSRKQPRAALSSAAPKRRYSRQQHVPHQPSAARHKHVRPECCRCWQQCVSPKPRAAMLDVGPEQCHPRHQRVRQDPRAARHKHVRPKRRRRRKHVSPDRRTARHQHVCRQPRAGLQERAACHEHQICDHSGEAPGAPTCSKSVAAAATRPWRRLNCGFYCVASSTTRCEIGFSHFLRENPDCEFHSARFALAFIEAKTKPEARAKHLHGSTPPQTA